MKAIVRPAALFVGCCLLWSAAGCYSGQDYAAESGARIAAGMSMAEVRAQLGAPDLVVRGDPGTETAWYYRYEDGASPICWILAAVFIVALIVVLVAASGSGGGGGFGGIGGGGGGEGPPVQIRILFDGEDRVADVSPPHPVPNPGR